MAKQKRVRWVCPRCKRGALGGRRPRLDDVVRYCFPCSTAEGSLVRRTAPVVERRRAAKEARTRERRGASKLVAQAKRDALWVYGGYDLANEALRMCKHPEIGVRAPDIVIRRSSADYCTGTSWGGRVVLSIPPGATAGQALTILAHEIAHEGGGRDGHGSRSSSAWGRDGHGSRWKSAFAALCLDLYGATAAATDNSQTYHHLMERAMESALEETE